jgi:mannose-6-phosphate isomerase
MGNTDILVLEPVFKERIWGGTALRSVFGMPIPTGKIGEAWCISAHVNGPSRILNGKFQGETLDSLYQKHRELFANDPSPVFPLLTKILDANDKLSVQIHPDDAFAQTMEHDLGKSECWYILDAAPNSSLIIGHTARTEEELLARVRNQEWDQLLTRVPVQKNDFVYIPAGTVHAIGQGILILETQQSSDVTYRLYDYDRIDTATGKKRELHLEKGLAVTTVPAQEIPLQHFGSGNGIVQMVHTPKFTVEKWMVERQINIKNTKAVYYLATMIAGDAAVNGRALHMGDSFIVPSTTAEINIRGQADLIVSYIEK